MFLELVFKLSTYKKQPLSTHLAFQTIPRNTKIPVQLALGAFKRIHITFFRLYDEDTKRSAPNALSKLP